MLGHGGGCWLEEEVVGVEDVVGLGKDLKLTEEDAEGVEVVVMKCEGVVFGGRWHLSAAILTCVCSYHQKFIGGENKFRWSCEYTTHPFVLVVFP